MAAATAPSAWVPIAFGLAMTAFCGLQIAHMLVLRPQGLTGRPWGLGSAPWPVWISSGGLLVLIVRYAATNRYFAALIGPG